MKIRLTRQKIELEEREVEIQEGDLVLLTSQNSGNFVLGVFREPGMVRRSHGHTQGITLERLYNLYPSEFFGEEDIMLISPKVGYREHTYDVNKKGIEFYVGQDKIIKKLRDTHGFEVHADWISEIKRPYLRKLKLD